MKWKHAAMLGMVCLCAVYLFYTHTALLNNHVVIAPKHELDLKHTVPSRDMVYNRGDDVTHEKKNSAKEVVHVDNAYIDYDVIKFIEPDIFHASDSVTSSGGQNEVIDRNKISDVQKVHSGTDATNVDYGDQVIPVQSEDSTTYSNKKRDRDNRADVKVSTNVQNSATDVINSNEHFIKLLENYDVTSFSESEPLYNKARKNEDIASNEITSKHVITSNISATDSKNKIIEMPVSVALHENPTAITAIHPRYNSQNVSSEGTGAVLDRSVEKGSHGTDKVGANAGIQLALRKMLNVINDITFSVTNASDKTYSGQSLHNIPPSNSKLETQAQGTLESNVGSLLRAAVNNVDSYLQYSPDVKMSNRSLTRTLYNPPGKARHPGIVYSRGVSILRSKSRRTTYYPPEPLLPRPADPPPCNVNTDIVVVVHSSVTNTATRDAVRNGWGSQNQTRGSHLQFYFIIGRSTVNFTMNIVYKEMAKYRDIIQSDFIDTYRNLSLKSIAMLRWAKNQCKTAKYILKADDDTYINATALLIGLERHEKLGHTNALYGWMWQDRKPKRRVGNTYYTPFSVWPDFYWPPVLTGPAYVISNSVTTQLLLRATNKSTPFVTMEDIFITGIVRHFEDIPVYDIPNMRHQEWKCDNRTAISFHRVYAIDHKRLWTNQVESCYPRTPSRYKQNRAGNNNYGTRGGYGNGILGRYPGNKIVSNTNNNNMYIQKQVLGGNKLKSSDREQVRDINQLQSSANQPIVLQHQRRNVTKRELTPRQHLNHRVSQLVNRNYKHKTTQTKRIQHLNQGANGRIQTAHETVNKIVDVKSLMQNEQFRSENGNTNTRATRPAY